MKWNKNWREDRWEANTIAACSAVILYVVLMNIGGIWKGFTSIFSVVSPVILGAVIAYVIDPFTVLIQRTILKKVKSEKWNRRWGVLISLLALLALVTILLLSLIPQLFDSISTFMNNIEKYSDSYDDFSAILMSLPFELPPALQGAASSLDGLINSLITLIKSHQGDLLNASMNIGSNIMIWVLGFILAIYFLLAKQPIIIGFKRFFSAVLSEKKNRHFRDFLRRCNDILVRYIAFDLVDGMIVGIINWIFMMITGLPYAVLISVVVGVTNLAPTFGPIVGGVVGAFILVLVNPGYAICFLIFTLILQTVDGYILKPKLFGDSLGISSVLILVSIIILGRIFGVVGVLLSIPIAAIVDFMYRDLFLKPLEDRAEKETGDKELENDPSEITKEQDQ